MTITDPDELRVLEKFRVAKKMSHADIELSVKGGRIVKLWITEKTDLPEKVAPLREGHIV